MWDLPGPGLEPVSPALAGGFSTTAPPGKPYTFIFYFELILDLQKHCENSTVPIYFSLNFHLCYHRM